MRSFVFFVMVVLGSLSSVVEAQEQAKFVTAQISTRITEIEKRLAELESTDKQIQRELGKSESEKLLPDASYYELRISGRVETNQLRKELDKLKREQFENEPEERKEARKELQREADTLKKKKKAQAEAFQKAGVIGCSPEETTVHPGANSGFGPKVTVVIHNMGDRPIPQIFDTDNKLVIENLCAHGIVKVTTAVWLLAPLRDGYSRYDGQDIKYVRWMARSQFGEAYSPEFVMTYYGAQYYGRFAQTYDWFIDSSGQSTQQTPGAGQMRLPLGGSFDKGDGIYRMMPRFQR